MTATYKALDIFGEILMARVRDKAIGEWRSILEGRMKDTSSRAIYKRLVALGEGPTDLIASLVPEIVDSTLHHLLWTLEQVKNVDIVVRTDEGIVPSLREASDGLAGELYSDDGWIARFSKEGPKQT